jgi:hypothetical protein
VFLLLLAGCHAVRPPAPVSAVDFIKEFDRAEKRPPEGFAIGDYLADGTRHPAIVGAAPSRLTWNIPIPRHATFRTVVAPVGTAPVRIRVGVSDARIYEGLAAATVTPGSGWTTVTADLSAYAGWKISLFYRPEEQTWRVNLSADAIGGVPAHVAWGVPEIVTTTADALEYAKRRARVTRNGGP